MSDQKDNITRRDALKGIGLGAGVIAALPVLGSKAAAQDEMAHIHHAAQKAARPQAQPLKFFNEEENRTVIEMSERIIPADDSSPGAKAARVSEYIDLIVSESPEVVKQTWREGLAAINKMSREKFSKSFADASVEQQVELLKEISRNERDPKTVEERFFRTIKNATIDGYYTSEIGIHQELHYKGNSYLKEFVGCTHPEHQQ
ncbi:MAG TPA: gluconate 2-dehydrogenase subunit 3 family protein [Blastocatellia bacterium]|nr:gluconate 2-dehydrogenase subunit 3 family protein [Blastocatellia bacterium]